MRIAGRQARPAISRRKSTSPPQAGFDRFPLSAPLLRVLAEESFTEPRPIQVSALPPALAGRDVLGLAQTGTGKTAAFALPILERLLTNRGPRGKGPRALVLAPTRELAAQVQAEFERLARHTRATSISVFGGVPIARQVRALQRNPDVVVACPGRLLDLVGQRALRLDAVEVLVIDEADHMFDMGFLPDVRRILAALPRRRQNLLFSATMPRELRKLADQVLENPVVVELNDSRPAQTITHALCPLAEGDKMRTLERLLAKDDVRSAIVFLRTKRRAKRLAQHLEGRGHSAVALQGNMSQPQRERALNGFRAGQFEILVATDVAARGLDISSVSHVVNFDVPMTPEAYTHRIGRTGRSNQEGTAFTFVTPDDAAQVRAIERHVGAPIERRSSAELVGVGEPVERSATKRAATRDRDGAGRRAGRKQAAKPVMAVAAAAPRGHAEQAQSVSFGIGVLEAPARGRGRSEPERAQARPCAAATAHKRPQHGHASRTGRGQRAGRRRNG